MKAIIGNVVLAFIALSLMVMTGCSPTGWATRDLQDGSAITPGTTVTIIQKDGTHLTGQFVGVEELSASDYLAIYNKSMVGLGNSGLLPHIGDQVEVTTTLSDARSWTGTLVGFDTKSMWVQLPNRAEPSEFYISCVNSLSYGDSNSLHRMQFRGLFLNGDLPTRSALVFKSADGEIDVPVNKIDNFVESPSNATSGVTTISMGSK